MQTIAILTVECYHCFYSCSDDHVIAIVYTVYLIQYSNITTDCVYSVN